MIVCLFVVESDYLYWDGEEQRGHKITPFQPIKKSFYEILLRMLMMTECRVPSVARLELGSCSGECQMLTVIS